MARVKSTIMTRKRRSRVLKLAKGYWGAKSTHFKMANQAVMKSLTYAYVGRKRKRGITASYGSPELTPPANERHELLRFMHGLKLSGIEMNRKMLSEMAIHEPEAFTALTEKAKLAIARKMQKSCRRQLFLQ